jgi:hypothetical protein
MLRCKRSITGFNLVLFVEDILRRTGNNILNKAKRELFYALAEYAKNNPEKWEKLIKLGDKFVDFTRPIEKAIGRGMKKLDDIFGD